MEAGNRCFDQRVPEETNRKIVDHISDINLTYSSIAREYLLREGLNPDRVIKTGSPMLEVLSANRSEIEQSDVLNELGLEKQNYFVVSAHREENINSNNFLKIVNILGAIGEKYDLPIIVSTHPRTRNKIKERGVSFHPNVRLLKPLGFHDYNHLQLYSKAVLSDSGTISEEASILKFPALNLREAHERPEAMEEAAVMMVGSNEDRVMQGLVEVLAHRDSNNTENQRQVMDYSYPNVAEKVVKIILSYTDYVNRVVWGKNEVN